MNSRILKHLPKAARQDLVALGQGVRLARIARGLTQEAVASRLEISPTTVGAIERGDPAVAIGIWSAILWLLGLSPFAALSEQLRARASMTPAARRRAHPKPLDDF